MKTLSITILALLMAAGQALTQATTFALTGDFEMSIEGTSNMHDWASHITAMNGSASIAIQPDGSWKAQSMALTIPVASIESEKGRIMDKKTMKALNAEEYPEIKFRLDSASGKSSATATGALTIAGVTKQVRLNVTAQPGTDKIVFNGAQALKMTDFGIDPPTALMGAMKVGDEITVRFQVTFTGRKQPSN